MTYQFKERPRRLRISKPVRSMIQENRLHPSDFVLPIFVSDDEKSVEISSMPGVFRWPIDQLEDPIKSFYDLGIRAFALFPKVGPRLKDQTGSEILNPKSLVYRAARALKKLDLNILLFADLALDPYTSHGQDGIVVNDDYVDNDRTVEILAKASIICADAGFDWVAPSDMMDGRIGIIRDTLEQNSFHDVGILSYSAKFSSSYYGPFRCAIDSSPQGRGVDKSTYQLNPANREEAKRELRLDYAEGADMLMVKPAEPFLDIISYANQKFDIPIAAYQVSGEYSRIMAADQLGWLDWQSCATESLLSIKRAGASIVFSYFADKIAPFL
jgi:porphobilinogen synthase